MSTMAQTLARTRAAFITQGVPVDALHAWIDYAHANSLARDDGAGMHMAAQWSHALHHATRHGTRGTMRSWFEAHKGKEVDTLQVHKYDGHVWVPPARVIDDVHATFVEIGGSRRYYREAHTLAQDADTLIIYTETAVCAYRVSEKS